MQTHRASRAAAVATAFVGGCVLVAAAASPGKTVAAPFRVVGADNTPIMIVGTAPGDHANVLAIFKSNKMMLKIQAGDDHSFFSANAPGGLATASLGVEGNTPYLKLRSRDKDRVRLDVPDGRPYVGLKGADGHGVLELHEGKGGGELLMAQAGGLVRIKAGVSNCRFSRRIQDPATLRNARHLPYADARMRMSCSPVTSQTVAQLDRVALRSRLSPDRIFAEHGSVAYESQSARISRSLSSTE